MRNFKTFLLDEGYVCKLNLNYYTPNKIISSAEREKLEKNAYTVHIQDGGNCIRYVMEA